MSSLKELSVPSQALDAEKCMELVRIWIADGEQVVTINSQLWKDPAAWGLMLVDLARHVTAAYVEQGANSQEVLERIKQAFDAEWSSPTDSA